MVDFFRKKQFRLIQNVSVGFNRPVYLEYLRSPDRLIGLIGARGVGKTTLLLQYLKELPVHSYLYVSADDMALSDTTLYRLAEELVEQHGTVLVVDEIHLYGNWAQELKNIYDTFPELKVRFSGSSMLNILYEQYDLSRRAVLYTVNELSFREFLGLGHGIHLPEFSLNQILSKPIEHSSSITAEFPDIYRLFRNYLDFGAYPFFMENRDSYSKKLFNSLEKVIHRDIPSIHTIKYEHLSIFTRLVKRIAEARVPFQVNVTSLAQEFGVSIPSLYHYIEIMEKTQLVSAVRRHSAKVSKKPDKLLFRNTNILHVFADELGYEPDIGTVRETFFISCFDNLRYAEKGDFIINGISFEVGGRNKQFDQIKNVSNAYLVIDVDITVNEAKIPLWLFGLMR